MSKNKNKNKPSGDSKETYLAILRSTKNEKEWNEACDLIKEDFGGSYPSWWYKDVLMSGFAASMMGQWPEDEERAMNTKINLDTYYTLLKDSKIWCQGGKLFVRAGSDWQRTSLLAHKFRKESGEDLVYTCKDSVSMRRVAAQILGGGMGGITYPVNMAAGLEDEES